MAGFSFLCGAGGLNVHLTVSLKAWRHQSSPAASCPAGFILVWSLISYLPNAEMQLRCQRSDLGASLLVLDSSDSLENHEIPSRLQGTMETRSIFVLCEDRFFKTASETSSSEHRPRSFLNRNRFFVLTCLCCPGPETAAESKLQKVSDFTFPSVPVWSSCKCP